MDIQKFAATYPRLYHMAERGSWPSIQKYGMLSTKATLDRANADASTRRAVMSTHRPKKVVIPFPGESSVVVRDQKPMSDSKLAGCLLDGITTTQWYEFLNGKVFFWATEERLHKLLNAGSYRNEEHDVLILDTKPFVNCYANEIRIGHINSGNTSPYAVKRRFSIFKPIQDYETKRNGAPKKEVAEVTVEYAVPDLSRYVLSVIRMTGDVVTDPNPYQT